MKTRIFVTLLLSTVLALPLCAQQANSTSSAQPPLQSASSNCKEPLQPAAGKDFWNGDEPNAANLIGHGLTRKKDVQRQIKPIQDCLSELDEVAASHTKAVKEMDTNAQQGIQAASAKVNEADQHATSAGDHANAAKQLATQPTARLSTLEQVVGGVDQYKSNAQTEIQFAPGQSVLNKKAKDALNAMAAPLKGQHNYVVEVRGFSSGHGQAAIASSQRMADSVVRYLVLNHEIPVHRIYVVGMGNAPVAEGGTTAKQPRGGRVEINLLRNDLVSSAQR